MVYISFLLNLGDEKITEILIDNGANINAANDEGMTPLHLATRNCDINSNKLFSVMIKIIFNFRAYKALIISH